VISPYLQLDGLIRGLETQGKVTRACLRNAWHVLMFQHQAKNTIQLVGDLQNSMALGLTRVNWQAISHSNQLSERSGFHLLHHLMAVNLDGGLAHPQLSCDLPTVREFSMTR
jgi:hypothetical protein